MALRIPQRASWEHEAIARAQQGDVQSFSRLIDYYKDWIHTRLYQWLGQPETTEELAQETWVRAFKNMKHFRQEASFSTWLFQIAFNLCRDHWRQQKHLGELQKHWDDMLQTNQAPTPNEAPQEKQLHFFRLRKTLMNLPSPYRETLLLRYLNDLSFDEMGQILKIRESALKMRVARGLEILKKQLKKQSESIG